MAINLVQGKQIATASWAINALTASYLEGYISPFPFTGSAQITGSLGITGSLNVTQGITGSLFGTASFAVSSSFAISSSFATTASFAVSSSRAVTSSFAISSSQATSASWAPLNAGGSNTQIQFNSGSRLLGTGSFTFNYLSQSLQQGLNVAASGLYSHAEGSNTIASGESSHAEGESTQAIGGASHAEGYGTLAEGPFSHAEGFIGQAPGYASHAEGYATTALGEYSHAEGSSTQAIGQYSHAEGYQSITGITTAFTTGKDGVVDGFVPIYGSDYTSYFTQGSYLYLYDTPWDNAYGKAIFLIDTVTYDGNDTLIQLVDTGVNTAIAYIGDITYLLNNDTFGSDQTIPGDYSHAEGISTKAIGNYSHAEGISTQAIGANSHAEGQLTQARGNYSHAEGYLTIALGDRSHAEGHQTRAIGYASHAEGYGTIASGSYSHAEGYSTIAQGDRSHAEGWGTIAEGQYQHVQGQYNIPTLVESAFIHGNGTDDGNRSNLIYAHDSIVEITGSLDVTGGITGNLTGTATNATNATSASYSLSSSFAVSSSRAVSSSFATTSSFATSASWAPMRPGGSDTQIQYNSGSTLVGINSFTFNYRSQSLQQGLNTIASGSYSHAEGWSTIASGSYSHAEGFSTTALGLYSHAEGNASIATGGWSHAEGGSTQAIGTGSHAEGAGTIALGDFQHVQGQFNISSSARAAFIIGNGVGINTRSNLVFASGSTFQVTGSVIATQGFTGSLFGTASFAATASNILGGKAPHIPFFITDTTLATSSLYQSGSSTVIINQDNATTVNPEALYVWQPHPTSFNVISGKGNIDNYLQLNIQNTNQGVSASSDVVATADNGDETTNYIDMGINGENYNVNFIGNANDAYLYSTGNDLHIGNASNKPVQIFAGGSDVDIHNKLILNPNNQHSMSGSLEISGSLNIRNNLTSSGLLTNGTNTILGNTVMSGSSTIQGTTTMTGSLLITGSTTQRGSNTLLGNTTLSGSIIISGALGQPNPTISVFGDLNQTGYTRYLPVTTNIDTSISGSYIFVSGSTNDLYFSQNVNGYANTTRLRWLEGNLYTGLLNGALITTASSTTFNISSGSGVVVSLNASLNDNPYPTIKYVNWGNLTNQTLLYRTSSVQTFVGIDSNGQIIQQVDPWNDGQYNTSISIGTVIHQNKSTINATITYPNVAYGYKQRTYDFIKAFGPLKLSGYTLAVSGSSTGSLVVGSGTAFADGRNYETDPNNPSYITDPGTAVSKIFRYYQSGSTFVQDTNSALGYGAIDPANYNNNGTLTPVPGTGANREWSIQRVFWYPNSATKGIVIYYGNATYTSEVDAAANIQYESFNETPNTQQNAIYLGALVVRNNANFTDSTSYKILPGGVFRSIGGSGGGGSVGTQTLFGLSDVAISGPTNGQPLVYNSTAGKWVNQSTLIANLTGTATTASYISPTFISASAAASGFGAGNSVDTGSLLTTASFNSYTGSNTSQFAGTASFATTAQSVLGSVTSAATASYSTNFTVANTLTLDGSLIDFSKVNSSIVGNNNLYQIATGSYTAAFTKYTVHNGTNARAGEFVTVWNGTDIVNYDNSTTDIGNTADVTFESSIVTSQIKIDAVTTTSAWMIKSTTTFI